MTSNFSVASVGLNFPCIRLSLFKFVLVIIYVSMFVICSFFINTEKMNLIDEQLEWMLPEWGTQKFRRKTGTLGESMVKKRFSGQDIQGIKFNIVFIHVT